MSRLSTTRVGWRRLLVLGIALLLAVAGAVAFWPTMRATAYLTDARRALSVGDTARALAVLRKADRLQRRRAAVQYLIGVTLRRDGRTDEAVVYLRQAAELGWDLQAIERQLWLGAAQRGELPDARSELLDALQSQVSNEAAEEIYEAFAKGYLAMYQLHDAWLCIDLWLQWRPEALQARLLRAVVYEQLGDYAEACNEYRAVLALSPHHRDARVRLAKMLMIRQEYDEARQEFAAQLAAFPDDAEALSGLAQCARRDDDLDTARRYVDQLLSLGLTGQQRGAALGELGRILLDQGQDEEAVESLRLALALVPGDANTHHALGTALARLGRAEEAAVHFARMQQLRTQFDRLTAITHQLADDPGNADLRSEAGAILIDAGLKKEGADWLYTALRCDPAHRRSHELLAAYFAEIGNHTLAGRHRLLAMQPAAPATEEPLSPTSPTSEAPASAEPSPSVPTDAAPTSQANPPASAARSTDKGQAESVAGSTQ